MYASLILLAVITLLAFASLAAYSFLEGSNPVCNWLYQRKLKKLDLRFLDDTAFARSSTSNVIVSLTTIPSRIVHMELCIKSLLNQTRPVSRIHLNLPRFSKRERVAYEVPAWLNKLSSVRIVPCDDHGPATKFLPAIRSSTPDQKIIVVDDDRIYPPDLVETLVSGAQAVDGCAVGMTGWRVPDDLVDRPTTILSNLAKRAPSPVRGTRLKSPYQTDILQGYSGYLIRPEFFDLTAVQDYENAPEAAFYVDDVWMSAHCKVQKFVVPARQTSFPPSHLSAIFKDSSLSMINRGDGTNSSRNNTIMIRHFRDRWLNRERTSTR